MNAAEQVNIAEADEWVIGSRRGTILDVRALQNLHRRMFDRVWRWAGKIRKTGKNLGVPAPEIEVAVRQLIDDVRYWVEHSTYKPDEIAVRFHRRLVSIHPFPNGNGRHARLAADALAVELGRPRFTWGRTNLVAADRARKAYIAALQSANRDDIGPLRAFARS